VIARRTHGSRAIRDRSDFHFTRDKIVELELVASGEKWGRGPQKDIHSSLEAQVDSPSWHLVQALNTLVEKDGHTPAVAGFFDLAKPLTERQKQMVATYAAEVPESVVQKQYGVAHWVHDLNWYDSLLRLYSQPTINIEGLVGGYTGPGGKTVLPHRAVAKIDMRLVPDMTAADTLAKLKAHLASQGLGDVEVNMTGGYDPTQTDENSKFMQAILKTYRNLGVAEKLHEPWIKRVTGQLLAAFQIVETDLIARPLAVTSAAINQAGVSVAVAWQFTQQMVPEVVPGANYPALREFSAKAEALPEFIAAPHGAGTYRQAG